MHLLQKWVLFLVIPGLLVLSACSASQETKTSFSAEHIHGFSYTKDGRQLLVATHDGLYAYENGKWSGPIGEPHDLMGFSLTKNGIFSSGHPASNSNKINPLGLIQSTDNGKTWKTIDFEGESDFHNMAAGYQTGAIYVFNEHPNSKIGTGLYSSQDSGKTWTQSGLQGIKGNVLSMGIHSSDVSTVGIGTDSGLFISTDAGNQFKEAMRGIQATSILFDRKNPDQMWVGGMTDHPVLLRYHLKTKQKEELPLPLKGQDDAIQLIAQHPKNPNQIAITTFKKHIYVSSDSGKTWTQLVKNGQSL